MNQMIERLQCCERDNRKLFCIRLPEKILDKANIQSQIEILKKSAIDGVCLVCSHNLQMCLDAAVLYVQAGLSVILETDFHRIFRYGIPAFAKEAAKTGISGIRVPNLPFEEQGQLAVYLLEEDGPFLIREITPSSGDRIVQNMQFARGFVWCSSAGNMDFLSQLSGDPLQFYMYAVEAAAVLPVLLDFGKNSREQLDVYLESASGAVIGNELMERFEREGYQPAVLDEYCSRFTD